jgi:riboflavin kinase
MEEVSETKEYDWTSLYDHQRVLPQAIELKADIVHGFKRGSKELGIPTANLNMEELGEIGESLDTGIYYGLANLEGSDHIAVVSVGWNPYYKNEKKTVEAHLLANLEDFYGKTLTVSLVGYLRPEANFKSLGTDHFIMQFYVFHIDTKNNLKLID